MAYVIGDFSFETEEDAREAQKGSPGDLLYYEADR